MSTNKPIFTPPGHMPPSYWMQKQAEEQAEKRKKLADPAEYQKFLDSFKKEEPPPKSEAELREERKKDRLKQRRFDAMQAEHLGITGDYTSTTKPQEWEQELEDEYQKNLQDKDGSYAFGSGYGSRKGRSRSPHRADLRIVPPMEYLTPRKDTSFYGELEARRRFLKLQRGREAIDSRLVIRYPIDSYKTLLTQRVPNLSQIKGAAYAGKTGIAARNKWISDHEPNSYAKWDALSADEKTAIMKSEGWKSDV